MSGWPWHKRKPTPPTATPAAPATRAIAVVVCNAAGDRIVGAAVRLDDAPTPHTGTTGDDGSVTWLGVPGSLTDTQLRVEADGYVPVDTHLTLAAGINQQIWFGGEPDQATAIRLPALQDVAPPVDRRRVLANFCNLRDATGRVIFSSCLAAMDADTQSQWIDAERAEGGTHYVLSVETGYPGYADPVNFYTAGRMGEFLATLDRVLAARLVPVVFLHSGDRWPGLDYFRGVLAAIPASYYDRCVWAAGWETFGGGYTARENYDAGNLLRQLLGPTAILAAHPSPGRLALNSWPTEPDDPHQGEIESWREWGAGIYDVVFYQSAPFRPGDVFDVTVSESPAERAQEVATRVLGTHVQGAPDWFDGLPRPTLIAFETVAYWQIRGQGDAAYARTVAGWFRDLGYQGFGNGLPTQ